MHEILIKINELQEVVFHSFYDKDSTNKGNPRTGWTFVLAIQDFSKVTNDKIITSSNLLNSVWSNHWQDLTQKQESVDAILDAIAAIRADTLSLLKALS